MFAFLSSQEGRSIGWPPKLPAAGGTAHSDYSMPSFGDPVQRLCVAGDWKPIADELWSMVDLEFVFVLGPLLQKFLSLLSSGEVSTLRRVVAPVTGSRYPL